MPYVTLDSCVIDPMIARRLEILETATASNDGFEPQPPLNIWQVRRVDALQDQWFDAPMWEDLNTRCELLVLDWEEADRVTSRLMTYLFDASHFFYAAGWEAAIAHQEPSATVCLEPPIPLYVASQQHWTQTEAYRTMRQWVAEWPLQWSGSSAEFRNALEIVKRRAAAEHALAHAVFLDAWLDCVALTALRVGEG